MGASVKDRTAPAVARRRRTMAAATAVIILAGSLGIWFYYESTGDRPRELSIEDVWGYTSERTGDPLVVLASADEPSLGAVAAPAACWYDIGGTADDRYGLAPLLFDDGEGSLDMPQDRVIRNTGRAKALVLGDVSYSGSVRARLTGSPTQVSIDAARELFVRAAGALVTMDDGHGYELATSAGPLASYLNIPVLVASSPDSAGVLRDVLDELGARYVITLGPCAREQAEALGYDAVMLEDVSAVRDAVLKTVAERFGRMDYMVMTNPSDVVVPESALRSDDTIIEEVDNLRIETGTVEGDIVGQSVHSYAIEVPGGVNRVQIYINFTSVSSGLGDGLKETVEVEPMLFAYLYDGDGSLVAFAPSYSLGVGCNYLETQPFDCPGSYELRVKVFYGINGFDTYAGTELGISRIDAVYEVDHSISSLSDPHLPLYPRLSMLAPYLAAAHGGVVLADPSFQLTTPEYAADAAGYGTGAYYEPDLQPLVNERAVHASDELAAAVDGLEAYGLRESYLGGPAWLSVLAGPNMVPQYYEPMDPEWVEDVIYGSGWATDNHLNLGENLSAARTLGHDLGDTSALVARTLFYEGYVSGHSLMIKEQWGEPEEWGDNFHFLAGELGGRTGWFFWQRGFAPEAESLGFETEQYYLNHENDRQTMVARGAYERANYFDLMMHGNWYAYVPELNGVDSYSTGVRNSDILKAPEDWELGPSMLISGSCLLGRIDGIPPRQSITNAFTHAGINVMFAATRSTGSEAKAGTIERGLIYDDISVGEAMRADKLENRDPSAYFVRMCFADPAFNPYEPNNGFSGQGRPVLAGDAVPVPANG